MDNNTYKTVILIVEDDKRLSMINSHALESEGYEIKTAFTLREARFKIEDGDPDLILLDVKMPDGNGFDFCREIRGRTAASIIFLTSVTEGEGELEGLVAGGDDYLRKPYSIKLLRTRVKNALQKDRKTPQFITRGPFTLYIVAAQAFVNGKDLSLTQKEFAVFLLLAQNAGKILGAEYIYDKVWLPQKTSFKVKPMIRSKNIIEKAVSRIRNKIEPYGYTIVTYRGKGYAFEIK